MTAFTSLSVAMVKNFVRDRAAVFFAFLFPLMFLVIFGLLYRDTGTDKLALGLAGDGPVLEALRDSPAVEATDVDDQDAGLARVRDGDLAAVVVQRADDVALRYAGSDENAAALVRALVDDAALRATLDVSGVDAGRTTVTASAVGDRELTPIQFLTPGILSWAVAFAGVSASALTLVAWRKKQVLRRLRLAPVTPLTILSSRIGVTVGIALVQGVLFVGVAMLPSFGLTVAGSWPLAIPAFVLGTLSFLAIGVLVGAVARTEEAANGAAQLVVFPMAFLSGAFLPADGFPSWLRAVSHAMPMRHLNDGLTDVLVRGAGVEAIWVPCLVLTGFTVVVGLLAARIFRWDDR